MFKNLSLTGNLTRDPEIRVFTSGKQVAKVSVAVNERRINAETKQWEDGETTFVDLVVFDRGGLIENVVSSLTKGDRVIVSGTLRIREYDQKDPAGEPTGSKGRAVELLVDEIGPSLRFAQTVITKVKRTNGGGEAPPFGDEGDYNI